MWLPKIGTGNALECVALGLLAHFAWLPDICGSLSLSGVCFDVTLTDVRPAVNFYSPVVSLRKVMFNIQQFHVLPTQCIYVFFCGSQNKQRLFPYIALTDWFV